jgi:hypothetical protein
MYRTARNFPLIDTLRWCTAYGDVSVLKTEGEHRGSGDGRSRRRHAPAPTAQPRIQQHNAQKQQRYAQPGWCASAPPLPDAETDLPWVCSCLHQAEEANPTVLAANEHAGARSFCHGVWRRGKVVGWALARMGHPGRATQVIITSTLLSMASFVDFVPHHMSSRTRASVPSSGQTACTENHDCITSCQLVLRPLGFECLNCCLTLRAVHRNQAGKRCKCGVCPDQTTFVCHIHMNVIPHQHKHKRNAATQYVRKVRAPKAKQPCSGRQMIMARRTSLCRLPESSSVMLFAAASCSAHTVAVADACEVAHRYCSTIPHSLRAPTARVLSSNSRL